jgi:hypothetical protein
MSSRLNGAASNVRQPPMAIPTMTFLIDYRDPVFMTANTVVLQNSLTSIGNGYSFRDASRVEHHHILCTVNAFPQVMSGHVLVGKVAVDALDVAVSPFMKPGFELSLHHMARGAEFRRLGSGQQLRRPKHEECAYNPGDKGHDEKIPQAPQPGSAHLSTSLVVLSHWSKDAQRWGRRR